MLLKKKEKNWAALYHGWHAFRLHMPFMAECQVKFEKKEKKKIGQHSAMDGMHLDCACHSWQSAMKSLGRKKGKRKIGQHSAMNGTHFICLHAVHGRVPWRVWEGRKKKNWAALWHERHTFYLSACCSWQSAMKSLERKEGKRKIGRHSAMNSTHFICLHAVHGRVPWRVWEGRKEKEKLGSTLPWMAHILFVRMLFMAECHEEFGRKRKKDMTCINVSVLLYKCQCVV